MYETLLNSDFAYPTTRSLIDSGNTAKQVSIKGYRFIEIAWGYSAPFTQYIGTPEFFENIGNIYFNEGTGSGNYAGAGFIFANGYVTTPGLSWGNWWIYGLN